MSKAQHTASRATHLEAPAHRPRAPHAAHLPIDPHTGVQARPGLRTAGAAFKTQEGEAHGIELPYCALQHQALPASEEHLE